MYLCERCQKVEAHPKEKYCLTCKKIVLAEMLAAGYLQRTGRSGHVGSGRPDEAKENTYETKHGTGHG